MTRARTPLLDRIQPQVLELEYPDLPAEVREALARLPRGRAAEGVADMLNQARKHAAGTEGPLLRFDVMGRLHYALGRGDLGPVDYTTLSAYVSSLAEEPA